MMLVMVPVHELGIYTYAHSRYVTINGFYYNNQAVTNSVSHAESLPWQCLGSSRQLLKILREMTEEPGLDASKKPLSLSDGRCSDSEPGSSRGFLLQI